MPEPTLRELLDVAMDAAYLAGRRTLAYFQTGVRPDMKADNTPVTIADREAEEVVRQRVKAAYPHHAILGEEAGETQGDADYKWIVDPIDGTKAFVAGVPLYSTLVGVEVKGKASVGVIYLPALGEMVSAATGLGCTWNGRPCHVSNVCRLEDSLLVASSLIRTLENKPVFQKLIDRTRLQRTWGDAFGYALVATGRAEIMVDAGVSPWDAAPLLPIITEAGGRYTDWQGVPTIYGKDTFATNAALFEPVLEILNSS
jgi:histidinol phosphatase-like enzyme (inositol monophosphatase family)